MTLKRTSHAVYDTCYHLVWCPKYRKDIFRDGAVWKRAGQLLKEIAEAYDVEIEEMEVAEDHVVVVKNIVSGSDREAVRVQSVA